MAAPIVACFVFGTLLRLLFSSTDLASWLANRVEVTTPINSWNRVEEGLSLQRSDISPYSGDIFHESPLLLKLLEYTSHTFPGRLHAVFVVADILIGFLLILISNVVSSHLVEKQSQHKHTYHKESRHLVLRGNEAVWIRVAVVAMMLWRPLDGMCRKTYKGMGSLWELCMGKKISHFFNPYSIASCLAKSTTVFSNIVLLLTVYYTVKGSRVAATFWLAVATYQSLYPAMLVVPLAIHLFRKCDKTGALMSGAAIQSYALTVSLTLAWATALLYATYALTGSLDFLQSTYGFILTVPDLTPNIGLFWYFFTEMFEHFRVFFLCVFQINAVIYTVPLAVKLREHPVFMMCIQIMLMSIFKSYPSYGDTALYLPLLALWAHVFSYMRNGFIVAGMYVSCTVISPLLWHLWIYAGSANANFFFAITLVFSTAQIVLLTDLLFAYLRHEFDLAHGPNPKLADGRKAKVVLN